MEKGKNVGGPNTFLETRIMGLIGVVAAFFTILVMIGSTTVDSALTGFLVIALSITMLTLSRMGVREEQNNPSAKS